VKFFINYCWDKILYHKKNQISIGLINFKKIFKNHYFILPEFARWKKKKFTKSKETLAFFV